MSPRIKRLTLDFERLQARFARWPLIQISAANGSPPEQYQFTYWVKGLYVAPGGDILEREQHILQVNLTLGYPRRAPQCKMLTPVFHPNFDDSTVCIGDFWAASEGLEDLVIRIGRMLAYQEYNVKSPLNGLAARWAAENASLLPVDTREIAPPLRAGEAVEEGAAITLVGQGAEGNGGTGEMGAATGGPLPLPRDLTSAQEGDRAWDGRILINLGEPKPEPGAGVSPRSDSEARDSAGVLRFSPGLKIEEVKVSCRACGQPMLIDAALVGEAFQCPSCNRTHRVAKDGA